ncbi:Sulfite exporter TauE/SafE family protein OS=Lysinibacillus sphaericus OX=1421 GN=LS41612_20885 PE=4 SV=1 [Lysinibacillus sphaericus]
MVTGNSMFGKKDVKLPSDEGTESNAKSDIQLGAKRTIPQTSRVQKRAWIQCWAIHLRMHELVKRHIIQERELKDASYMDSQGNLQIIEGKFIEKKWAGEMPVLYNFYGEASWLTAVLDANGFLQNYFIVSAANPEISAYATTPKEALKLYKTALSRGGSTVEGSSNAEEKNAKVEQYYAFIKVTPR